MLEVHCPKCNDIYIPNGWDDLPHAECGWIPDATASIAMNGTYASVQSDMLTYDAWYHFRFDEGWTNPDWDLFWAWSSVVLPTSKTEWEDAAVMWRSITHA